MNSRDIIFSFFFFSSLFFLSLALPPPAPGTLHSGAEMNAWYSALRQFIHARSPKRITQLVTAGCRLYVLVRVHVCLCVCVLIFTTY